MIQDGEVELSGHEAMLRGEVLRIELVEAQLGLVECGLADVLGFEELLLSFKVALGLLEGCLEAFEACLLAGDSGLFDLDLSGLCSAGGIGGEQLTFEVLGIEAEQDGGGYRRVGAGVAGGYGITFVVWQLHDACGDFGAYFDFCLWLDFSGRADKLDEPASCGFGSADRCGLGGGIELGLYEYCGDGGDEQGNDDRYDDDARFFHVKPFPLEQIPVNIRLLGQPIYVIDAQAGSFLPLLGEK